MRDVQPPIMNDQELSGYRAGLVRFNAIVAEREAALFASQHDSVRLELVRQELYRGYARRQGILDAIAAYERQHGSPSTTGTAWGRANQKLCEDRHDYRPESSNHV